VPSTQAATPPPDVATVACRGDDRRRDLAGRHHAAPGFEPAIALCVGIALHSPTKRPGGLTEPNSKTFGMGGVPATAGRGQRTKLHGLPPMPTQAPRVDDGVNGVYLSDPNRVLSVMAHEMHVLDRHRLDGSAR